MKHFAMAGGKDKPPDFAPDFPRDSARDSGPDPSRKAGPAFDLWLRRGLHELYDEVAKEPIPPEILKLIEDDKNKKT